MSRISLRRLVVAFRRTSRFDQAAILVLLLYILVRLIRHFGYTIPGSSFLGFLSIIAAIWCVFRLIPWIRRSVLWRLRNRLIVAYLFMAVIPVVLLIGMSAIGVSLLELQIGAHLLRDDLDEPLSILSADTDTITAALSREPGIKPDQPVPPNSTAVVDPIILRPGVASVVTAARKQWPDIRVYLNHGQQVVRAANGKQFKGLAEFRNQLWFACAESIPVEGGTATVLVIAPLTSEVLDSFPANLGPIELTLLEPAPAGSTQGFPIEIEGRRYVLGQTISSKRRTVAPATHWFDLRIPGGSTLTAKRADLGPDTEDRPVLVRFSLRLSAVNKDLLTSVGALGPFLIEVLVVAAAIFLILEIAALVTGIAMTRTITSSVADLYDGTLHVRRGDFSHRVQVRRHDQLGALGDSFNEMTSSITELIEEQRQRQRLENEISIAREVQQQLFPHTLPRLPGLELAAICRPARVVSGDYYDFIPLGPSSVGIALADISGKGIFAALLMASLQAALRSAATIDGQRGAAEIVSRVNRHLFTNTSDDRYATLFYAVYDSSTRTLTYTNAGHLPPFLIADGKIDVLDQGGTVVGLFEDAVYVECSRKVEPGSLLVAFSDGLTEPENVYGEEFGVARLQTEILRHRATPPPLLAEETVAAVEQWAGTPDQADDITLVVARMG